MDNINSPVSGSLENCSRSATRLGAIPTFDSKDANQNIPTSDFSEMEDFGRDSLGIINLENLDMGRESLWIMNIKSEDLFRVNMSELTTINSLEKNNRDFEILNTAVLNPAKDSARFSFSSCDSIDPSPDFINISNSISPRSLNSPVCSNLILNNLSKLNTIDSLSFMLKDIMSLEKSAKNKDKYKELNSYLTSAENPKNNGVFESNEAFNDSVFIEANHLASRIEDGSIFDLGACENDMLDSIQEPEDLANLSPSNVGSLIHDKAAVFKIVDRILPSSSSQNTPLALFSQQNRCDVCSDDGSKYTLRTNDPKDILTTLMEIIKNNDLISEKQKYDGQNMISNLAAMLLSTGRVNPNQLDDSGHSSIENDPIVNLPEFECYEVLDLRKKKISEADQNPAKSPERCYPLDLSLKSKSSVSDRIPSPQLLPPKLQNDQSKLLIRDSNIGRNYLNSNNDKSDNDKNKFKLKKIEEKPLLRKGPMKAVVPLDNMAQRKSSGSKSQITSKRNEVLMDHNSKQPDTPISRLTLKPVAQSTPDGSTGPNSSNKSCSSNNQSSKFFKQKSRYSRSSLHSVNKHQDTKINKNAFVRRYSVDDMSKNQPDQKRLSRSSSMNDNVTFASVRKITQSVSPVKQNSRLKTANFPVLKENRNKSANKSTFARKSGKENWC